MTVLHVPHSFESGTAKGYVEPLQSRDGSPCRCRANLAHSRQSGPDSGLSLSHFQAKLFKILQVTPFLLGSGRFLPNPPLARVTCPRGPLFSEYGTQRTVKARFWPCFAGRSPSNLPRCSFFVQTRLHGNQQHLSTSK